VICLKLSRQKIFVAGSESFHVDVALRVEAESAAVARRVCLFPRTELELTQFGSSASKFQRVVSVSCVDRGLAGGLLTSEWRCSSELPSDAVPPDRWIGHPSSDYERVERAARELPPYAVLAVLAGISFAGRAPIALQLERGDGPGDHARNQRRLLDGRWTDRSAFFEISSYRQAGLTLNGAAPLFLAYFWRGGDSHC
jgi:hypothetical protein